MHRYGLALVNNACSIMMHITHTITGLYLLPEAILKIKNRLIGINEPSLFTLTVSFGKQG